MAPGSPLVPLHSAPGLHKQPTASNGWRDKWLCGRVDNIVTTHVPSHPDVECSNVPRRSQFQVQKEDQDFGEEPL